MMMKKSIAILTALLLLCALCLPALADEAAGATNSETFTSIEGTKDIPIAASTDIAKDGNTAVYSCTISWNTEEGNYSQTGSAYTWDPATLSYTPKTAADFWTEVTAPSISVTVTNYSNVSVTAAMSFAAAEGITAYMGESADADAPTAEIASAVAGTPEEMVGGDLTGKAQTGTCEAEFHVTDGFDLLAGSGKIGTATVTLTFGDLEDTYSTWDNGWESDELREWYENYDPLENFTAAESQIRDTDLAE